MQAVHRSLHGVQPLTVPQIIAAIPIGDVATREAIRTNDPVRMERRVRELSPYQTLAQMRAGWALLVALATSAGNAEMVTNYCECAALDLGGAL